MSAERTARRLAAILAADIVGYSRLMGADEEGTAQMLREHRAASEPLGWTWRTGRQDCRRWHADRVRLDRLRGAMRDRATAADG